METMIAYIDPGSGTILLQVLIGGLLGMSMYFRRSLGRFLAMFRKG